MGNIISRHATNVIDSFVLRLAHVVDTVLRAINRKLSTFSSLFFSRVFGYDVVLLDDASPVNEKVDTGLRGPLYCGPGNVCIVPASRLQQRELEKKRRSERRKRAEAAALGADALRRHKSQTGREKVKGYEKVESPPNSPTTEEGDKMRVMQSLGPVAKAPLPRSEEERETIGERERGELWVLGNVKPRSNGVAKVMVEEEEVDPLTPVAPETMEKNVLGRGKVGQRTPAIQPRKSSKLIRTSSSTARTTTKVPESVVEVDHPAHSSTPKKETKPLAAPTPVRLPPGALTLGPSPWEPAFRHPFSSANETITTDTTAASTADTSKAASAKQPQQWRMQSYKPRLSLDTHLESSPLPHAIPAFIASPLSQTNYTDEEPSFDESPLQPGLAISRPPSRTRSPAMMLARKSIDAISLRSVESSSHAHATSSGVIDVKTLATKAVKEEKGRKGWKGEVNKVAMQRVLHQRNSIDHHSGDGKRRLSMATLGAAVGGGGALARVRTQDGVDPVGGAGGAGGNGGRRGSVPVLGAGTGMGMGLISPSKSVSSGRTTPMLRAESPLHAVIR